MAFDEGQPDVRHEELPPHGRFHLPRDRRGEKDAQVGTRHQERARHIERGPEEKRPRQRDRSLRRHALLRIQGQQDRTPLREPEREGVLLRDRPSRLSQPHGRQPPRPLLQQGKDGSRHRFGQGAEHLLLHQERPHRLGQERGGGRHHQHRFRPPQERGKDAQAAWPRHHGERTLRGPREEAETDARNARRARRAAKGRQPTTENAEEKKP